jgi:hypothetical protein
MVTKSYLAVLFFLCIEPLLACSCFQPSFEEQYNSAQVIVTGRVIGRKVIYKRMKHPTNQGNHWKVSYFEYRIEVQKAYKGATTKILKVVTAREGATCGMHFKIGRTYVVYALADKRLGIITSTCERNILAGSKSYIYEIAALEAKQR